MFDCRVYTRRRCLMEGAMKSLGKRLTHIAHRERWLLFSTLIESPENGVLKQLPSPKADERDAVFSHPFFKNAHRINRNGQLH